MLPFLMNIANRLNASRDPKTLESAFETTYQHLVFVLYGRIGEYEHRHEYHRYVRKGDYIALLVQRFFLRQHL